MQLVEKDPDAAIVFFWKAMNEGDRGDSALKDMAVVLKQQDRAEEAIEAIRFFRDRCSVHAQESLDNVLIDLYKVLTLLRARLHLARGQGCFIVVVMVKSLSGVGLHSGSFRLELNERMQNL